MKDFWLSCGHHLLDRDRGGGLVVTDDFLKAYLARRELTPPPEACVVERTLHAALLADPRRPVDPTDIAAIADADARENWAVMVAWRDLLVAHRTIEAAYLHLVRGGIGRTPPLFVNQLVHVILRNVLDDCEDAFMLRAAELLFRPQRLTHCWYARRSAGPVRDRRCGSCGKPVVHCPSTGWPASGRACSRPAGRRTWLPS